MSKNTSTASILRLKSVIDEIGVSRSSIYNWINAGSFPSAISLGARSVGFLRSDIDAWIESRIAASRPNCGAK